jgi:hypothetical protein
MATHGSVAKSARLDKEARPELYCPERRCLWRTGGGWCPRHRPTADLVAAHEAEARVQPMISDAAVQRVQAHANAMGEARDSLGRRPHGDRFRTRLEKPLAAVLTVHVEPWQHQPVLVREPGGEWVPLEGGAA